ncbi:MAG TPA: CDP-diacylglycerol--glycerol-3-phosphate 3-phosphatidyltransferase [Actinomycetota bacterium]|jgi:CDP-diacylglycerol--glycerol-3-phosphate 3-phosphatidyltransferase
MNVPNSITVVRVFMVPVFVALSYKDSTASAVWAFVVFLTASLSDFLDGYLARRNGTESRLGQFLDPLADKLLVGAALVVLVDTRAFPLWAAIVIAAREIAVQLLRTSIVQRGGTLPASPAAKLKTMIQILMVGWWLLPWSEVNVGHWALLASVLVTTLWSGYEYFAHAGRIKEAAH